MGETKADESCLTMLVLLALAPGLAVAAAAYEAWAVETMWRWFVSPAPPAYAVILGACLIVSLVGHQVVTRTGTVTEQFLEAISWSFVRPTMLLGYAWLIRWALL